MRLRKHLPTVIIAVVASAVTAGAPAIAHGVHAAFAHNADKVDGKHAVGAGATVNKRKGKLVATKATTGRLPNNIISKAPDANKLDGVDSSALMRDNVLVAISTSPSNSNNSKFQTVSCPAGRVATGGGAVINGGNGLVALDGSHPAGFDVGNPNDPAEHWWANAHEGAATDSNWTLTAYAVCAAQG